MAPDREDLLWAGNLFPATGGLMRLCSFLKENRPHLGMITGDSVLSLPDLSTEDPSQYGLFAGAVDVTPLWNRTGRMALADLHARLEKEDIPRDWSSCCVPVESCAWLSPVAAPEKIICIGLNYRDHAAESKMEIPKEPVFFNKYNNALTGAGGPVVLPSNSSQVDYEAELAVIVGREARRVTRDDAMKCVGGYTLMHDVSARDWQFRTGQWVSGKTFDTFGPCGPWIVTPDDIPDPHTLDISLKLNGRVMQCSNTSNLIFSVPVLISYLSDIFTLRPGDIISTGTPPGVGFARKPPVFLKEGDVVEITVDRVGTMHHTCVAEAGRSAKTS